MPPRQVFQQPCGCVDEIWAHAHFTILCPQHLSIVNSQQGRPQTNTTQPQTQMPNTIPGIPSHPSMPFQMGGFFHPGQMPQQGEDR